MGRNEITQNIMNELNLPNEGVFREWTEDHFNFCELLNNRSHELIDYNGGIKYNTYDQSISPAMTYPQLINTDNDTIKKTFGFLIEDQYQGKYIYAAYFKNECLVIEKTCISIEEEGTISYARTTCKIFDKEKSNVIVNLLKKNMEEYLEKCEYKNIDVKDYSTFLLYAANTAQQIWNLTPDAEFKDSYQKVKPLLDAKINELSGIQCEQHRTR